MAGLVPAIHVFSSYHTKEDVDARHRRQVYAVCAGLTALAGHGEFAGEPSSILRILSQNSKGKSFTVFVFPN